MNKTNVNGIELAIAKVDAITTKIRKAQLELEELAIGIVNDCGGEFVFDDTTGYPSFQDDSDTMTEAICSVKVMHGGLWISTDTIGDYFQHDKFGVADVENICRIILNSMSE